ncbi:glycoside hydrolase family 43 protein [Mucilaginibacter sp. RS28]|uniref:Glycoside hydrolase family 43 protein n=1 Tax=Mucilaginibacter straminoryzae TaxID=2932774 RepID=A0A9X2B918_9SPHI|nr:glycoside hydrolase family 43 protein [Mucilaginibacter straminoryzae]MCJ8210016.1 glycoside hydrolase family 43 protein [Mucilaginibacter straminoryzae]
MLQGIKYYTLILLVTLAFTSCRSAKSVYLFTSFHEPADSGLRFLYSYDAYHWKELNHIFLKPQVGEAKIMRDPSIAQGPDGIYHLVWTTGWKNDKGIGYASSKDLIHWSAEQHIEVMANEPETVNAWAPELFYDDEQKQFIIVWASTIPFRFPKGQEDERNNHRLYYTTTKDFKTFSPSKLFLDPQFSVIDAQILKRAKSDYVLVMKDNTRPNRNILVAFATNPLGPYHNYSKPFTENFSEGPCAIKAGDDWIIYYDSYQAKRYGAVLTRDFKTFKNITDEVDIPKGHKHGTVFKVDRKTLNKLKEAAGASKD